MPVLNRLFRGVRMVTDAAKINGGVVTSPNILTEGSVRKGGLNGPTQIMERPAPPPPFRPATAGNGPAKPAKITPPQADVK